MNTQRDPSNPEALRVAMEAWLKCLYGTRTERDEADMAFESVLLDQGVMNPDEAIEAIRTQYWDSEISGLLVKIESGPGIYLSRTTGLISALVEGDLV